MNSPLPPPPPAYLASPLPDRDASARRRPGGGVPSNAELLAALVGDDAASDGPPADASKARRRLHLEAGPFVVSGAALERARARAAACTARLTLDTLRPLPLFLGVTGPAFCLAADAFSPPVSLARQADKASLEKVASRLARNLHFFATNYALVALCTLLVVALLHPAVLAYVGLTWALWWGHAVLRREDVRLALRGRDVNELCAPARRARALTAWTAWVAVAKCLRPSLKGMAVSGALILLHALMRDPSRLAGDIVASRSGVPSGHSSDSDDGSEVLVEREDAV